MMTYYAPIAIPQGALQWTCLITTFLVIGIGLWMVGKQ